MRATFALLVLTGLFSFAASGAWAAPLNSYDQAMEPVRNLAIQQATMEIDKDPQNAGAYAKRGKAYAQKRDFKSALLDYNKALELDPKLVDLYPKRAVAYFMLKDLTKSAEDVRRADQHNVEVPLAFRSALEDVMKESAGG